MNRMKVQHTKAHGQYIITIPKAVAQMLELSQGQSVEWRINAAGRLELVI